MKKTLFSIIGLAAFGAAVVLNASIGLSGESLSDITLANIEALAMSETLPCTGGIPVLTCAIWDITYYSSGGATCFQGGDWQCALPY